MRRQGFGIGIAVAAAIYCSLWVWSGPMDKVLDLGALLFLTFVALVGTLIGLEEDR